MSPNLSLPYAPQHRAVLLLFAVSRQREENEKLTKYVTGNQWKQSFLQRHMP